MVRFRFCLHFLSSKLKVGLALPSEEGLREYQQELCLISEITMYNLFVGQNIEIDYVVYHKDCT